MMTTFFRQSIVTEISKKRTYPLSQQQSIIDRWSHLNSKIDNFNKRMGILLGGLEWNDDNLQTNPEIKDHIDNDDAEWEDELHPSPKLLMPSTYGRDSCIKNGCEEIADQEIHLRIAQAQESLDDIRLALGHKSLLYKLRIRKAKSQHSKTRSRAELIQLNAKITQCAERYRHARIALLSLGAPMDKLELPVLIDSDLQVNTDIAEESRIGQRNYRLSWIWRIGGKESTENPWMDEST